MPARWERLFLAVLAALVLAAYWQTLSSSFHFDDYALFADPYVTAPDGWWRVWRPGQTRPLTYFTFWVNYRLGGSEPWGYHALNLGLHLLASAVAWRVFRRLLGPSGALAATAVFALHPLQSEAVAYVFARATLLATVSCLLAWRDWLDGRRWLAAVWFALGLLAKEECVAFPIFLLVVDHLRRRWPPDAWPAWTTMLAASVAAGARLLYVAAQTPGSGLGLGAAGITTGNYLFTQSRVVWKYFSLFLLPVGQNFDHDVPLSAAWDPVALAAAAALGLLMALAWRRPGHGVWLLGALVLLAPSSSFIPVADLMFEHRLYLPMISLGAGVGALCHRIPLVAALVIAALATPLTWARARIWSTEETLWSDAADKSPGKARPRLQLARAVASRDPQRAEALILEARRLAPNDPETFIQLGLLRLGRRDASGALDSFDHALLLRPDSADAHSNRGIALYLLARLPEAESEFLRALQLSPCHTNARHNLVLLYSTRGEEAARRRFVLPPAGCQPAP